MSRLLKIILVSIRLEELILITDMHNILVCEKLVGHGLIKNPVFCLLFRLGLGLCVRDDVREWGAESSVIEKFVISRKI